MAVMSGREDRNSDQDQGSDQAASPPSIFFEDFALDKIETLIQALHCSTT
jgi:hypothetical protein